MGVPSPCETCRPYNECLYPGSRFMECPKWCAWAAECKREAEEDPDHWIHDEEDE